MFLMDFWKKNDHNRNAIFAIIPVKVWLNIRDIHNIDFHYGLIDILTSICIMVGGNFADAWLWGII